MRNIELKPGANITIKTSAGKVVIGVSDEYNEKPRTILYFMDNDGKATDTVRLDELLYDYEGAD